MPALGYRKHTYTGPRPWESADATPFREVGECSRGELRFAAEVTLALSGGHAVPGFAFERATNILRTVAA